MCRQIGNEQSDRYYTAQRQVHKALIGDTPVKTVQNSPDIDNIIAYDREVQRISKVVHHKLDLGQNSLPREQLYTMVKPAAYLDLTNTDNTQYNTRTNKKDKTKGTR